MGRAILMSIHPEWVKKIASGEKTIEVRKNAPLEKAPFRVYIYQTKPRSGDWNAFDGAVVGEFLCKSIFEYDTEASIMYSLSKYSCLSVKELKDYAGSRKWIYGWNISDVQMYDAPYCLEWYHRICLNDGPCASCLHDFAGWTAKGSTLCEYTVRKPPQSWMYVAKREGGEP